jgi:hypothetical protein
VPPGDFSQLPVEQLARLLLERARHDPALPSRSPANSNECPSGWIAPPPAQACRAWLPHRLDPQPRFPGQEQLEALVAEALTAAQDAEAIAQASQTASRRANRGAAIAMVVGLLGAVFGLAAGVGPLLDGANPPTMEAAADPVQPADPPVPVAAAQPATPQPDSDHAGSSVRDPQQSAAQPALAPATFVRVLPAVATPSPDMAPSDQSGWSASPGLGTTSEGGMGGAVARASGPCNSASCAPVPSRPSM